LVGATRVARRQTVQIISSVTDLTRAHTARLTLTASLFGVLACLSLIFHPLAANPFRTLEPTSVGALARQAERVAMPSAAAPAISAELGREDTVYHAAIDGGTASFLVAGHSPAARVGPAGGWVTLGSHDLGLRPVRLGRGDAFVALPTGAVSADANRIDSRRGDLTEWYVNGPAGIEQGFTLARAIGGSATQPLTISLALAAGVAGRVDADRRALTLLDAATGGPIARYSGLVAFDSTGHPLPAWLEVYGGEIQISVDDAGAVYPILVDPLVQNGELTASDGAANDWFGFAVAVDGDTIVVGAKFDDVAAVDQGSAYVYVKPIAGWATTSGYTAKLTASDGATLDYFGTSVAISGDTIVVGANEANVGAADQGAAYIFVRPVAGWATTSIFNAKLTAFDGAFQDRFGQSVAIDGDTVVVGAPYDDGGFVDQGSAYVYRRPGVVWVSTSNPDAKLTALNGASQDFFGVSVAINADTIVVGAVWRDFGVSTNQGTAYVYVRPGPTWSSTSFFTAQLTAADGAANDWFGYRVAANGDTIVIGAPGPTPPNGTKAGKAYVYVRPAPGWATTSAYTARLTASDGATNDRFGFSVSLDGNTVVVGAPYKVVNANSDQGAAYAFARPAGGWGTASPVETKMLASDGETASSFGVYTDVSGDTVVVGSPYHTIGVNANQGSAYVFTGTAPVSTPPNIPSSPGPANGVSGVLVQPTFTWVGGDPDGDAVTYTIYLGTASPPVSAIAPCTAITSTACVSSTLAVSTTYYWQVVATDNDAHVAPGPIWSFTTSSSATIIRSYIPIVAK
jgi:hypothetical protein